MRRRLKQQLREMFAAVEYDYPEFFQEAKRLLPDKVNEPRFEFVIRRIWRRYVGELPDAWREYLRGDYEEFVSSFKWDVEARPAWIDQQMVEETLALWQVRSPVAIDAEDAVEMIVTAARLAETIEVDQ